MQNKNVKVAVAQVGSSLFNPERTLEKLEAFVKQAAKEQAQLILFPEAFIGGYPKGLDFGVTLGIRTDEGRKIFQQYFDSAIEIPSPQTQKIGELAQQNNIEIITGAIERFGGTLYCVTLHFASSGELIHHHRKIMPTALERVVWGQGDGKSLKVVVSSVGRIGKLICWENYMPLARQALYEQNLEIHCTPTVDDRDLWIPTLQHIAREGRCFVLSSCQYLQKSDYPADLLALTQNLNDIPIRGGSCIISPLGEFIVPPIYNEETIIYEVLDKNLLAQAKYDLDVAGHYARRDIFNFKVSN